MARRVQESLSRHCDDGADATRKIADQARMDRRTWMKGRMNQKSFSNRTRRVVRGVDRAWLLPLVVGGICLSLFLIVARPTGVAQASISAQLIQQPDERGAPTQPIDVVVVLDDSGSMATCWPWPREGLPFSPPCRAPSDNPPSDPDELRYSAARLLLQLADDDDRLAMVRFDSIAEGVGALGALTRVGDGSNRQQLAATIQPPSDYLPRGYTRIDLGMQQAIDLLTAVREPGRSQYVVLLTDGEPTEQGNVGDQKPRIVEQLATLRNDGVLVFPVVLCNPSAGCSGEFLREQFGDDLNEAKTPQELLRVFSEIWTRDQAGPLADCRPQFSGTVGVHHARAPRCALGRAGHPAQWACGLTP